MKRIWKPALLVVATVVTWSCTQPEAEAPEPEAPAPVVEPAAEQPDPTTVDADHYKVEFDNDRVRALRVTYGGGEESVMHYHPEHVAVFLSDQHFEFTLPDGTTQEIEAEKGEMIMAPAGQHVPRNLQDEPAEVAVFELKPTSPDAAPAGGETGPDVTEADPGHYEVEFENEQVRVMRVTYGPGEESVMHYHPEHAAVFLSDQHFEFELPDGSTQEIEAKRGDMIMAPAGQHLPRNLRDETAEVVVIELN